MQKSGSRRTCVREVGVAQALLECGASADVDEWRSGDCALARHSGPLVELLQDAGADLPWHLRSLRATALACDIDGIHWMCHGLMCCAGMSRRALCRQRLVSPRSSGVCMARPCSPHMRCWQPQALRRLVVC